MQGFSIDCLLSFLSISNATRVQAHMTTQLGVRKISGMAGKHDEVIAIANKPIDQDA